MKEQGFSISPFSLPLENRVFIPKKDTFQGLFGVFYDSLPDGWGRLLVDRMLRKHNVSPASITELQRLAIVGSMGMGALEYVPKIILSGKQEQRDFDFLSGECEKILLEKESDDLDLLMQLGGSSGGARPKIMLEIDGEAWIVKFPSHLDSRNIGKQEYEYMLCAKRCGI